jgi:hypothetical protein
MILDLPLCWVCKHPVDSIHRDSSFTDMTDTFTVRCHGDEQTVKLSAYEICDANAISIGFAFKPESAVTKEIE